MTSMLQSASAGYPDRGAIGARITLDDDLRGVGHGLTLSGNQGVVHTRLVVRAQGLAEGRVVVLAASDASGSAWWLEVDGSVGQLVLVTRDHGTIAWALARGPSWNVVEVVSDAGIGRVTLRVNGVEQGDLSLPGLEALEKIDLGALWRDAHASGWIDADEWIVSTSPIGPVVVEAKTKGVADPARWVVLYRVSDPDSVAWAEEYALRRKVPYANLMALDVPGDEVVGSAGYASVLAQFTSYLDVYGLRGQVAGILVGYGVPGYVELTAEVERLPLGSMLATDLGDLTPVANPGYAAEGEGLEASSLLGMRLSARIDGVTLADALALVDRGDDVMAGSLLGYREASIWVDTDGPAASSLPDVRARHEAFVQSESARATRMPVRAGDGEFSGFQTRVQHDAIVWNGMGGALPTGYFEGPAGPRALLVQAGVSTYPLVSLREEVLGSAWALKSLDAGYAAIGGASMTSTVGDVPDLSIVMDRLRQGWTLAEAWYAAQVRLQTEFCLVGDPLMRVPMGHSGWDVISAEGGALSGSRVVSVREEITDLRDERLSDGTGEEGRWLVIARDGRGEVADGVQGLTVVHDGASWVDAGIRWVWPSEEGWPLNRVGTSIRGAVIWPCGLTVAGVRDAELEIDDDGVITRRVIRVDRARDHIAFAAGSLPGGARLRLRVTMASGVDRFTPWSASLIESDSVPVLQVRRGE